MGGGLSVLIGVFLVCLFLFLPDDMFEPSENFARIICCIPIVLLQMGAGLFIMLQLNWKIEVKEDRFVFTNTFKKRREYKFDEIEERQLRACYRYYHNGKHIVCISMLLDDFYMLSDAIAAYRLKKKKEGEIQ